jgi:hypothetical protein
MTKPREPWVTVNMSLDVHEIETQTKEALAELSHAGRVFVETMDKLGFPAAVIISIGRDPR